MTGAASPVSATDPSTGTIALVVAVVLGAAFGGFLLGILPAGEQPTQARFSVSATPAGWLTLTHRGGPAIDVRTVRVYVLVDGTPLTHQPPVPFFAATGFRGGPRGPFNAAGESRWTVGERAAIRVAKTNQPAFVVGARVTVRLYRGGDLWWSGESVVRDGRD